MNTNKDTSKNINDKKFCFFHEVYCGTYDCNYCGENYECLSNECGYAFRKLTKTSEDEEGKITRVVNNFTEGYEKMFSNTKFYTLERYNTAKENFTTFVNDLIQYDTSCMYPVVIENYLLKMSFNELRKWFQIWKSKDGTLTVTSHIYFDIIEVDSEEEECKDCAYNDCGSCSADAYLKVSIQCPYRDKELEKEIEAETEWGKMLYESYLDDLRAQGARQFPFAKW